MEKTRAFSYTLRFRRDSGEVKDSAVVPALASCLEMDKELAMVATAKMADVRGILLEEIFQSIVFLKLLDIRR